jgi:hypothetical protein
MRSIHVLKKKNRFQYSLTFNIRPPSNPIAMFLFKIDNLIVGHQAASCPKAGTPTW